MTAESGSSSLKVVGPTELLISVIKSSVVSELFVIWQIQLPGSARSASAIVPVVETAPLPMAAVPVARGVPPLGRNSDSVPRRPDLDWTWMEVGTLRAPSLPVGAVAAVAGTGSCATRPVAGS